MRISDEKKPFAKSAIAEIELLQMFKKTSLLQVKLITGRKHQIRAQLSHLGFPICGDKKYGKNTELNKKYPFNALCAYRLEFESDYPELINVKKQKLQLTKI